MAKTKQLKSGVRKPRRIWPIWVLVLIYVISPLDLIPDWLAGPLGFTDDGLALLATVLLQISENRKRRAASATEAQARRTGDETPEDVEVVKK